MKKSIFSHKLVPFCIVLLVVLSSCSKMNDLHDVYLERGETIYVGKPDSVRVLAGKDRVKVRYWASDPKAAKLIIYWLSRTDSMVVDIPPHLAKDPVDVIIPKLSEYSYSFELVTTNKDLKNRSVSFQASGSSYGASFQSSLTNRVIESSIKYPTHLEIKWLGEVEKGIGSEIEYVNTQGVSVKRFVPMSEKSTLITNYSGGSGISYRTLFLPEPTAIDTFSTALKPIVLEKLTDKSKFLQWNPTGIPYSQLSATYSINKLWDNDQVNTWYISNAVLPFSFTFDMGQTIKLKRFVQWQRLTSTVLYRTQNVKKFELWGSATPNVNSSFTGWVKLGDYESIKPSGTAVGSETAADVAFATAGESFTIDPSAPPVRYIRFVAKETWGVAQTVVAVGEMTFFEPFQ